jgi:hypothetical protein
MVAGLEFVACDRVRASAPGQHHPGTQARREHGLAPIERHLASVSLQFGTCASRLVSTPLRLTCSSRATARTAHEAGMKLPPFGRAARFFEQWEAPTPAFGVRLPAGGGRNGPSCARLVDLELSIRATAPFQIDGRSALLVLPVPRAPIAGWRLMAVGEPCVCLGHSFQAMDSPSESPCSTWRRVSDGGARATSRPFNAPENASASMRADSSCSMSSGETPCSRSRYFAGRDLTGGRPELVRRARAHACGSGRDRARLARPDRSRRRTNARRPCRAEWRREQRDLPEFRPRPRRRGEPGASSR